MKSGYLIIIIILHLRKKARHKETVLAGTCQAGDGYLGWHFCYDIFFLRLLIFTPGIVLIITLEG